MKLTPECINRIYEDKSKWDDHVQHTENDYPNYKIKSFEEMFGYEIIFIGGGMIDIRGQIPRYIWSLL